MSVDFPSNPDSDQQYTFGEQTYIWNGEKWVQNFSAAPQGLPSGGVLGQILSKASGTDYDVMWIDDIGAGAGSGGGFSTIWAEENASLSTASNSGYQFSFGNGGENQSGIRIGYNCTAVRLFLISETSVTGADVEVYVNGSASGVKVTGSGTALNNNIYLNLSDGDRVTFRTNAGSGGTVVVVGLTLESEGVQGATGSAGSQGATGSSGPQGTTGATGPQGATGAGTQGATGIQGFTGAQGSQGTTGGTGSTGIQGATGSQGPLGPQGATGAGTQGPQGTDGIQGVQGISGDAEGPPGPQGTQGPQGADGTDGTIGADGADGPQGPQGATGAGTQGATGADGADGPQGATGADGSDGAQGAQGPQGPSGGGGTGGEGGVFAAARTTSGGVLVFGSNLSVSRSGNGTYNYTFDSTRGDTNYGVVVTPASGTTDPNCFVQSIATTGFTVFIGVGDNGGTADVATDIAHSVVVFDSTGGGLQGATGPQGATGAQGAVGPQGITGTTGPQGTQGATGDGTQGTQGPQGADGSGGTGDVTTGKAIAMAMVFG